MDALTGFDALQYGRSEKIAAFLRDQPFKYEFHFLCLDANTTTDTVKTSFLNAEQWVPEVGKDCDSQWKAEYAQEWMPAVGGMCITMCDYGYEDTAEITAVHEDDSVDLEFDDFDPENVPPSEFS